jgi:lauroyl/myristoyl acyltransferase
LPGPAFYRAGVSIARRLPPALGLPASRAAGRVWALGLRDERRMLARHLRRASGGELSGLRLRRAVGEAFGSYGRYWFELLRLPEEVRAGRIDDHCRVLGFEHIEAGLERGNGVVVALPHLGGWEYAGAWFAARGHRVLAVAEPLEPPETFEWFLEMRRRIGIDIVPLGPDVASELTAALRANRVVGLVCDRDLTGDGVEVEFFGEATRVPAGPALLAFRTGAVLLPTAVYFRRRGGHEAIVRPPLRVERAGRLRDDVARVTQMLVHEMEALIRAEPEQWHLLQPNWPSDAAHLRG